MTSSMEQMPGVIMHLEDVTGVEELEENEELIEFGTTESNNIRTSNRAPRGHRKRSMEGHFSSPPSTTNGKPSYQKVAKNSLRKLKFHSKSCEDVSQQERVFLKLNPKNPQHAHKIQQRKKAIAKGKNTIGYDIYCRKITKAQRQKRSMVTPSTPDHTLDIPNKKWNGMVRSWRVALHRYDPVDLKESFARAQEDVRTERKTASQSPSDNNTRALTIKEQEIAISGLSNLVRITPNKQPNSSLLTPFSPVPPTPITKAPKFTPFATPDDDDMETGGLITELNRWEASREDDEPFFSGGEEDDSDDDLL